MTQFPNFLTERYQQFKSQEFAPNIEEFHNLATEGQSPDVMVVSCCDSRVTPEAIFRAGPHQ